MGIKNVYLKKELPILLLFTAIIYFPLFLHLDTYSIRLWDESRLANNAIEMLRDGNFIVKHFNGEPDLWSTKPPLVVWLQVFFLKTVGLNELAIRLPSALAGLATVFLLVFFGRKLFGNPWPGYLAGFILVSSRGFIHHHITRTGDNDAMLILGTTLGILSFFTHLQTKRNRYLYWAFAGFTIALLSKSISAFFMVPGLLVFVLLKNQLAALLKNKHFYLSLLILLVFGFGYYALREFYNPGFLQAVWENELFGRYSEVKVTHSGPFSFYFRKIVNWQFAPWFLLLFAAVPLSVYSGKKQRTTNVRDFVVYGLLTTLICLLVLSLSKTKTHQYIAQIFPVWALVAALPLHFLLKTAYQSFPQKQLSLIFLVFIIAAVFYQPYKTIIAQNLSNDNLGVQRHRFGYFQQTLDRDKPATYLEAGYNAPAYFYIKALKMKGYPVQLKKMKAPLKPGERVVACEVKAQNYLKKHYHYELIRKKYNCLCVRIKKPKNHAD